MLPGSLLDKLQNHKTSLSTVLNAPHVSKYASVRHPAFEAYFLPRSKSLLLQAFSHELNVSAINAFCILLADQGQFLRPVLESGFFARFGVEVLQRPNLATWVTGRLASLTLVALLRLGALAQRECVFLYRLLQYSDHPAVHNLFESITSLNSEGALDALQRWLRTFGFCQYVIREAAALDFLYQSTCGSPFRDPVYNRAACLYDLISRGCNNAILQKEFRVEGVVQCLTTQFEEIPDFVQTARWRAIAAVTCEETAALSVVFYTQAVAFIVEDAEQLREYRVLALCFLGKMLELDDQGYAILLRARILLPSLITLVFQFASSTLLHDEFLRFTAIALRDRQFAAAMLMIYVPVVVDNWERNPNRIVRSTCLEFMRIVVEAAGDDQKLANMLRCELLEVQSFTRGPLRKYLREIQRGYGGEVPTVRYSLFDALDW
jgi:hypothetical protein